ncbi:DUF805 domain-containing protein [Bradyrhizobium diazoefficiens]|nr:DUF805 domain-containing protein [Bradyrhizobium diazoefficiens]MBR0778869.1 DUF805 domain-containing protein [Bradyrhizobium diazoefficiens]
MDWTRYLFRFDGRICRGEFWFGLVCLLCALTLTLLLVGAVIFTISDTRSFNLDVDDVFKVVDPAAWRRLHTIGLPLLLSEIAGTGLLLWMYLAISVKRLHDRNKSGWWMMAFFVYPGLYQQFVDRLPDSLWIIPFAAAAGILPLWALIEIGFLRGTSGANRFGPDPLTEAEEGARSSQPSQPWDQRSELELVPPSASPPGGMHVKRGA